MMRSTVTSPARQALGTRACRLGFRVPYTSVQDVLKQLRRAGGRRRPIPRRVRRDSRRGLQRPWRLLHRTLKIAVSRALTNFRLIAARCQNLG
jgi:hypothetical protein